MKQKIYCKCKIILRQIDRILHLKINIPEPDEFLYVLSALR